MATKDRTSLKNDFANGKYATGEKFADLIDSMKVVQLPVVDPQALGTSLSFIDSISQDADGKITATKKTLDLSNAHELNPFKGWYKTGDTLPTDGFDGAYLYFKDTSELTGQTTIYSWNGTAYADTGTVVDTSNVQTFGSGQHVNMVKIKDENGDDDPNAQGVLSAEAGLQLGVKLRGVTARDIKISDITPWKPDNANYHGFYKLVDGNMVWESITSGSWQSARIDISGCKEVRFLGVASPNTNVCYGLTYENGQFIEDYIGSCNDSSVTEPTLKEYRFENVPENAKYLICLIKRGADDTLLSPNFYCYIRRGSTVLEEIEHSKSEMASQEDVMQLKAQLYGVTANETKVNTVTTEGSYIKGANGNIEPFSNTGYIEVELGDTKSVRFLGAKYPSTAYTAGYAFGHYTDPSDPATWVKDKSSVFDTNSSSLGIKEYNIDKPEQSTHFRTTTATSAVPELADKFYCYFRSGKNVVDMINNTNDEVTDLGSEMFSIKTECGIKDIYTFEREYGKYLKVQNGNYSIGTLSRQTIFITKPIFVKAGTVVEIHHAFSYSDMATIFSCDENGENLNLILLSTTYKVKEDDAKYISEYVFNEDTWVMFSSSNRSTDDSFEYGVWAWTKSDDGNTQYNNLMPIADFESISADAAGEMSSWTIDQIITNIYEPLRAQYPEYIKRSSLGKDASNTYDIWLYEFNNTVDEWFSTQNAYTFFNYDNGAQPLQSNQFRISKSAYDNSFSSRPYYRLYVLSDYAVRKPILCGTPIEETIDGQVYYLYTCNENVKILQENGNNVVQLFYTKKANTWDQHCCIISGIHGNEPCGYLGLALSLKYLIEHHSNNRTLDYIFKRVKLSVIPCVNVWGANQSPKNRNNSLDQGLNNWNGTLSVEQQIVANFVSSVKTELSFFVDLHTSELWNNYGFVYAIANKDSKLLPALVSTAGYLCKHWFPNLPPYNWNIGTSSMTYASSSVYCQLNYNVNATTVEFCGQDLIQFGNCSRWDAKYMSYCIENYVNYLIALCSIRVKSNTKNIIDNDVFKHTVMS